MVILFLPLLCIPLPRQQPCWLKREKAIIDISKIYLPENEKIPNIDLKNGKHILAFLSPNCPHCKLAAYKMHLMKLKYPNFPFFIVIGGTKSNLDDFWLKTKAQNLDWSRMDKNLFMQITGGKFPLILWIENGTIVANCEYVDLDQSTIENWLLKRN